MTPTFRPSRRGIRMVLRAQEVALLEQLAGDLREALAFDPEADTPAGSTEPTEPAAPAEPAAKDDDPDVEQARRDGLAAVHARLFPPAVLGDEQVAAEVRDLLEEELLRDRLAALEELLAVLERGQRSRSKLTVELTDDEPRLVLMVLNDLRLAIGARIDVEALDRETIDEHHPAAYPLAVMDHLGWWQEQLLMVLDGDDGSGETT